MKNKKGLIALVAMLGIVLITAGATYAWFSYSKSGSKEHSISAGSITFHYQEGAQGLSLNDAMPMSDSQGIAQNQYFDFTITSKTSSTVEIPYDITVRRSGTGTNMDNVVKVYLTKVNNNVETPVEIVTGKSIATVSELLTYLNNTLNIDATKNEKKLTTETVPVKSSNYNQAYRLRMWISTDANFALVPAHCSDNSNKTENECVSPNEWIKADYPYNNKTYTLKVNVYGEGNVSSSSSLVLGPGLYDANGNIIKTWAELESLGLTKEAIETDYTWSNWNKEGSIYKMFTDNNLTGNLVFPDTITKIGDFAFYSTGLTGIEIPASVTSFGMNSFRHTGITSVTIPASVTSIGDFAFYQCSNLATVTFEENNQLTSIGQYAFNNTGISSIEIPASVTSVGDYAFKDCSSLATVNFAENSQLTSIGNEAFKNTGITSIIIPSSVTSIGYGVFEGCSSLAAVTLAPNSNLTSIGYYAFKDSNISSIEIPSGVTSIGHHAFSGTTLTSAIFANPNGWTASSSSISSTDLSNASTAATRLLNSNNFTWVRSD